MHRFSQRRDRRRTAWSVLVAAPTLAIALASSVGQLGHTQASPAAQAPAATLAAETSLQVGAKTPNRTAAPVSTTATPTMPVVIPKVDCAALAQQDFGRVASAPTTILSATLTTPSGGAGAASFPYCDVKGVVAPQVQFELQLPTQTYQQRYLQEGCGGYCGSVGANLTPPASSGCLPLNNGTFAVGQDDEGHIGGGSTEVWAINDPALKIDFGYRSEHVFARASKAIINAFYGVQPKKSYYDGCSDGGREALMEAQRYPHDFNGVIAGAPAQNQAALNAIEEPYEATLDFTKAGQVILPASKLPMLHNAVLAHCATPGLQDNTIQDPRDCAFTPSSIRCANNVDAANCLTDAQVRVVNKIYNGAVNKNNVHLYTGGEPKGSEDLWAGILIPPSGQGQSAIFFNNIGSQYLKYVGQWEARPNATVNNNEYTVANLKKYRDGLGRIYDSTDPDLSAFHRAGGKLIQWAGWTDQFIPPTSSTTYYQAVKNTMGPAAVTDFYRLYMFPAVGHCGGGDGPNSFDLLTPMLDWVEGGVAPTRVVAARVTGPPGGTGTVQYTRPVYPYPELVKYSGSGDVNDEASYVGYTPTTVHKDNYQWAGAPFRSGYEASCKIAHGVSVKCTRLRH